MSDTTGSAVPAMTSRSAGSAAAKARAAWEQLNERQRAYLVAIYEADQEAEAQIAAARRRWEKTPPASDLGYRGVAAAAATGAAISATIWIRRLPPRAPLARYSTPALLIGALAAAVLSLLTPAAWAGPLVLAAVVP